MKKYSLPGINGTWHIERIAKNELLNKEFLIREVTKNCNWVPKGKIYKHISKIMREYKLTEQEVVYLFLRLWFLKEVKNFNFIKAFNDCEGVLLNLWLARYRALIEANQQDLIIV